MRRSSWPRRRGQHVVDRRLWGRLVDVGGRRSRRGEPSETARPAVVALVLKLCSNERAAPRRSSAQHATTTSPTARVRRRPAAGAVLQGRRASSSARVSVQTNVRQLVSIFFGETQIKSSGKRRFVVLCQSPPAFIASVLQALAACLVPGDGRTRTRPLKVLIRRNYSVSKPAQ